MGNYFFILFFGINIMVNKFSVPLETNDNFKLITFETEDGGVIEASLFECGKNKIVIFAHGAIFNKESWYFLCEKLQSKGVTSLAIDFRGYGNSKKGTSENKALDILGAIDYLKEQGYKNIELVGGSMGAMATLNALEQKSDSTVIKVVLLSPAGGHGISSRSIEKLFVVSKDEGLFDKVKTIYETSSDPKELKIFEGDYHAQHMFKSDYANELTQFIVDFLTDNKN